MSIKVQCSSCRTKMKARSRLAGKRGKCPFCGQVIVVPSTRPAAQFTPLCSWGSVPPAASKGKATVAPPPIPQAMPARWPLYAGSGVAGLCLVVGLVFIFAMLAKDGPAAKKELAMAQAPTSEVKLKPETKPEPRPKPEPEVKVEPKPEEKVEPKPKPEPKPEAKVEPRPEPRGDLPFALPANWMVEKFETKGKGAYVATLVLTEGIVKRAVVVLYSGKAAIQTLPARGNIKGGSNVAAMLDAVERALALMSAKNVSLGDVGRFSVVSPPAGEPYLTTDAQVQGFSAVGRSPTNQPLAAALACATADVALLERQLPRILRLAASQEPGG